MYVLRRHVHLSYALDITYYYTKNSTTEKNQTFLLPFSNLDVDDKKDDTKDYADWADHKVSDSQEGVLSAEPWCCRQHHSLSAVERGHWICCRLKHITRRPSPPPKWPKLCHRLTWCVKLYSLTTATKLNECDEFNYAPQPAQLRSFTDTLLKIRPGPPSQALHLISQMNYGRDYFTIHAEKKTIMLHRVLL